MTSVHAIILGLVQGLTEFLPISSSGHLILVPKLLGWPDQGLAFDAMVHLGTALATVYHYRRECHELLKSLIGRSPDAETKALRNGIIIASVPAVIVAFLAKDFIDTHARNVTFVATNLILWGVLLLIADYVAKNRDAAGIQPVSKKQALVGGMAQAFALFPGTSRSGSTIASVVLAGQNRPTAVKFSFLLGLPIILGVSTLSALQLFTEASNGEILLAPLLFGLAASFVGGLLAIRVLLALLAYRGLTWFALYRFALAGAILLFLR